MTLRALLYADKREHRKARISGSFWMPETRSGEEALLWFICPCGCGQLRNITVGNRFKPNTHGPSWNWNGSLTEPTLSPSVDARPVEGCAGWHGWLRDGYWEAV